MFSQVAVLLLLSATANALILGPISWKPKDCTQFASYSQRSCISIRLESKSKFVLSDEELGSGQIELDRNSFAEIRAAVPECTHLSAPPKGRVSVHRLSTIGDGHDFSILGELARSVIDEWLPKTGAVLLRNLPISQASDFKKFWNACLQHKNQKWTEMSYIPFSEPRAQLDGVDLATNIPPGMILPCHNELAYNPRPAGRIALYCLQEATVGGESLVAWNRDITQLVPTELIQYLEAHGGICYDRLYYNAKQPPSNPPPYSMSWSAAPLRYLSNTSLLILDCAV